MLLLVDNAPSHIIIETVITDEEGNKMEIFFFPPNVTSILQPMDQGVIAVLKKLYRKELLRHFLINQTEEDVIEPRKKLDLKDADIMACNAWSAVKNSTIYNSWKKLWPQNNDFQI